ncbi:SAM-dependent methyltransferase [Flavobacterium aquicola]|uniref:SAM-dependent methyltransferase n=1 Tax=Flavobacterium aquicola TaxID=1682742 RepID=A0A3E0ERG7_9FLAO|nr:SAM-dependent methyltransferase [Flavobacterium aquicola]REG99736.1 hypothetical protein C8P67_104370 [Flavobacterium aquicola]
MAFELKNVVPWGRTLEEYTKIFKLTDSDLDNRIISFGDGPASFNSEMTKLDKTVVSLDPIYQFTKAKLKQRIDETKETVMEQMRTNQEKFVWKNIKNVDELEQIRMGAMSNFINDFELGKEQQRYVYHELPNSTKYNTQEFDLGLSSHFLLLYSQLGLDFHIQSITEMLRISKEIRIFPILNLNAVRSEVLEGVISHFESDFDVKIESSDYEFQKGGNEMLIIKRKSIK